MLFFVVYNQLFVRYLCVTCPHKRKTAAKVQQIIQMNKNLTKKIESARII